MVLKTYAIGDVVWIDADRDGLQGEDEAALEGVMVTLTDADGKPVKDIFGTDVEPVETDVNGRYIFDNLPAGEYKVHFGLTDNQKNIFSFTVADAKENGADKDDSDADQMTGWTTKITLDETNKVLETTYDVALKATQGIDPTWDAGVIYKKVSVGDFVWYDKDANGLQDEGEPGIPGVVLKLTKVVGDVESDVIINEEPVPNETTGDKGEYLFKDLPALKKGGKYRVTIVADDTSTVTALEPYVPTKPAEGTDREKDSSTASTDSIIDLVVDGTHDPSLDFGFVLKKVSVGDYVWVDSNRDGVQDEGEPGISGVVLDLTDPDGEPVTDVFGKPVGPVTTDINGDPVVPVVTNEQGEYMFDNLPTGNYQVKFELTEVQATKYIFTALKAGLDGAVDSNATPGTGLSDLIVLDDSNEDLDTQYRDGDFGASEGIDPTWDAGVVVKTYAIGDIVWVDTNRDGLQDEAEVLTGVTVTLLNDKGDVIATTVTDKSGRYLFDKLPAGDYQVKFELTKQQAAKYKFTALNSGTNAGADSDADSATGLTKIFKLDDKTAGLTRDYSDQEFAASEGIDPTWDAGVVLKSVSVGDKVWEDKNQDGRQDKKEPGIPGVVLEITGPDGKPVTDVFGNPVKPVTTDKDGNYLFSNLPVLEPGKSYTVSIDKAGSAKALEKFLPTKAGQGNREGDSSTWKSNSQGLTEDGESDLTLDFGFIMNPKFTAETGTDLLVPAGAVALLLAGGAFMLVRSRKSGRRRA